MPTTRSFSWSIQGRFPLKVFDEVHHSVKNDGTFCRSVKRVHATISLLFTSEIIAEFNLQDSDASREPSEDSVQKFEEIEETDLEAKK